MIKVLFQVMENLVVLSALVNVIKVLFEVEDEVVVMVVRKDLSEIMEHETNTMLLLLSGWTYLKFCLKLW